MNLLHGSGIAVLLLLASIGCGRALRVMSRSSLADLPAALDACIGLTVLCWLAGWLVLARSYSRGAGWALLAGGMVCLVCSRAVRQPRSGTPARVRAAVAIAAVAATVTVVRALGALHFPFVNFCDDWAAYYHFPKLLLESGGLDEPFNLRRLGVLGIGPLLQSFFWPVFATGASAATDAWLGQVLFWRTACAVIALVDDDGRGRPWRAEAFGLFALLVSFAIPVSNSSPTLLPLAGSLALLCLTYLLERAPSPRDGWLLAAAWGFLGAWLVGYRTSNAILPALIWLTAVATAAVRRDRPALWRWAGAASALAIALLPWSLASWLSSGTPLFPLFDGNYRFPKALLSYSPRLGRRLLLIAVHVWYSRVWLLILFVLLLLPVKRLRGISLAIGVAAVGTVLVTALSMPVVFPVDVYRYTAPLVLPGLLFLVGISLGTGVVSGAAAQAPLRRAKVVLPAATVVWLVQPLPFAFPPVPPKTELRVVELGPSHVELALKNFGTWLGAARKGAHKGWRKATLPGALHFHAIQERLAPDARVVSAVAKPFHWQFDLHVVHTLDCVGQTSPPPGMPFFEGPLRLADYFLDLGYTHLAFTPPNASPELPLGNCLYSRSRWQRHLGSQHPMFAEWAPYFLDFLQNEALLEAKLRAVYAAPDIVVVDLRKAREPSLREALAGATRHPRHADAEGGAGRP